MSTLSSLCEAAQALVQLELDIGDVFTGYQRGDEILAAAWPRRESLWDTIQQLAKDALAEAASDLRYSTIEIRVSDLMVHCRALYLAGRHIHHRKVYNSERAVKAANENSRRITELSRQVEDAIARLRLLSKTKGAATTHSTKEEGLMLSEAATATATNHPFLALLRVFTDGVSDERIQKATQFLTDAKLTVDEKLTKIDRMIQFPVTASANDLAQMLGGVSKTAVIHSLWWQSNRAGKKAEEIDRRRQKHQDRAEEYENPTPRDDDQ
jgi:hypothetical protein